jgi:hypothetical protein
MVLHGNNEHKWKPVNGLFNLGVLNFELRTNISHVNITSSSFLFETVCQIEKLVLNLYICLINVVF